MKGIYRIPMRSYYVNATDFSEPLAELVVEDVIKYLGAYFRPTLGTSSTSYTRCWHLQAINTFYPYCRVILLPWDVLIFLDNVSGMGDVFKMEKESGFELPHRKV